MLEANKETLKKTKAPNRCPHHSEHPDHSVHLPSLRRIEGQVRGIQNMIEENRYCVDILVQFRALQAAVRAVETKVFETHINNCIKDAFESQDPKASKKKISELVDLIAKRSII